MAASIIAAVNLKARVLAGVEQQQDIDALLLSYTKLSLFGDPGPKTTQMRRDLVALMRTKYFPRATESGRKSAVPILNAVGGAEAVEAGATLTGSNLTFLSSYRQANTRWFASEVDSGTKALSGELNADIARASRDGIAQTRMRRDVINSYEAELKALKSKRRILAQANRDVAKAEASANAKVISAAKKVRRNAQAGVRRVSTAMGRLENKVQGAARDAVRREAQRAELASFRQAGYRTFTWVAVNGSLACPDCSSLHGETRGFAQWHGNQPGDGHTVCMDSCVCELVPNELMVKDNITGPVNPFLNNPELTG